MNIEIRLKAWDKGEKKMSKPFGLFDVDVLFGTHPATDDLVFILYTGRKDRNKTEIYAGDIIKDATGIYKVVWDKFEDCCVRGETWMLNTADDNPNITLAKFADRAEVIGNVWDNPELIESN